MSTKNAHLSFWERESFLNYDVIIVGAGITGLSTAISLKEKLASISVLVLEKSLFPSGASTKNAGFACFGSLSELLADIDGMGTAACVALVEQRWHGLQKLRNRFSDQQIGFEALGGYELVRHSQSNYLERLHEVNELLYPVFKEPVFEDVSSRITEMGFSEETFRNLIYNRLEGQIDTGKTIAALWERASALGIKILTGAEVKEVNQGTVVVEMSGAQTIFNAAKVVLTTNAFTKKLLPEIELQPGRGQVMITKPIKNLKCKGTFHVEEGYYYFRNVGDRLLLGGGRNLDFAGEQTIDFGRNPVIENHLKQMLANDILPSVDFEIDHQWSGIMAFGADKQPVLKWVDAQTLVAVRLGGMGMAIGSSLGEEASNYVLSNF